MNPCVLHRVWGSRLLDPSMAAVGVPPKTYIVNRTRYKLTGTCEQIGDHMKKRNSNFRRGFIYIVRNKVTGRVYCGQQSRFYNQGLEPDEIMGKKYWTSNPTLAKDWKAHPDDYEWTIVEENITDKRELDWAEACCIMELWEQKIPCYNRWINLSLAKRKEDEPVVDPLETVDEMVDYVRKLVESHKRMESHLDALEEGLNDV